MPRITSSWTQKVWQDDEIAGPLIDEIREVLDDALAPSTSTTTTTTTMKMAPDLLVSPTSVIPKSRNDDETSCLECECGNVSRTNSLVWRVWHYSFPSDLEWETVKDDESGRFMYYNRKTGHTTWERPHALEHAKETKKECIAVITATTTSVDTSYGTISNLLAQSLLRRKELMGMLRNAQFVLQDEPANSLVPSLLIGTRKRRDALELRPALAIIIDDEKDTIFVDDCRQVLNVLLAITDNSPVLCPEGWNVAIHDKARPMDSLAKGWKKENLETAKAFVAACLRDGSGCIRSPLSDPEQTEQVQTEKRKPLFQESSLESRATKSSKRRKNDFTSR